MSKSILQKRILDYHKEIEVLDAKVMRPSEASEEENFFKVFEQGISAKSLNLSKKNINDSQISYLIKFLDNHQYISNIDLSGNNITMGGTKDLANLLQKNKSLTFLNLNSNDINYIGIALIEKAIKNNKILINIDIRLNKVAVKGLANIENKCRANQENIQKAIKLLSSTQFNIVNKDTLKDIIATSKSFSLKELQLITHLINSGAYDKCVDIEKMKNDQLIKFTNFLTESINNKFFSQSLICKVFEFSFLNEQNDAINLFVPEHITSHIASCMGSLNLWDIKDEVV